MNSRGFGGFHLRRKALQTMLAAGCLLAGSPPSAWTAENCVARSIDQTGKCQQREFARRVVEHKIRGKVQPATVPAGVHVGMLATQLENELADGDISPITHGRDEWILLTRRMDRNIYEAEHPVHVYLLRIEAAKRENGELRPSVRVLAAASVGDLIYDEFRAQYSPKEVTKAAPVQRCFNAETRGIDNDAYPQLGGEWRWKNLSDKRKLLVAPVSRNEGYAGGGGTFSAEMLLEVRDHALVPVACYLISRYQMFGGNWNPDGTRQHPESQAAWRAVPDPITKSRKGQAGSTWPDIRLEAATRKTPSASLRWDDRTGYYLPSAAQSPAVRGVR